MMIYHPILHKDIRQLIGRCCEIDWEDRIDLYSCFQGDWGSNMKTEDYCNELRRDLIPANA